MPWFVLLGFVFAALYAATHDYFSPFLPEVTSTRHAIPRGEIPRGEIPRSEIPRNEIPRAELGASLECPVPGRTDFDDMYLRSAYRHLTPAIDDISGACWEKARAQAESRQNPRAVSPANAIGVMQLLPGTFSDLGGHDIYDPAQNINAGIQYSSWCYDQWSRAHNRTPNQIKPLADGCYNWGLGNLLRIQRTWGCVNWDDCFREYVPDETSTYTRRIDQLARRGIWVN